MAVNNSNVKTAVSKKRVSREQVKTQVLTSDPTKDYRYSRPNFWGETLVQGLPPWRLWTGRMMIDSDPLVAFGLNVRNAALMPAEVDIKCNNPMVANWLREQWDYLWNFQRGKITSAKRYGFAALQVNWKLKKGLMVIKSVKDFAPEDTRCLQRDNKTIGMTVKSKKMYFPQSLWMTFNGEYGNPYGVGCTRRMYPSWYEKWMDHGAKRLLQLRMIKDSYIGDIFWYPPNLLAQLPDGTTMPWKDLMRELAENRLSGGAMTLPMLYDDNGKELTKYSPPQDIGGGSQIFEWNDLCDKGILQGADVPLEVIEAADTGSGYSGRSIPFLTMLSVCNSELSDIVRCIDECALRAGAWLNWGGDVDYEIKPKNLVETFSDDTQGSPMGGGAIGGQPSSAPPQQPDPNQQPPSNGGQGVQFAEHASVLHNKLLSHGWSIQKRGAGEHVYDHPMHVDKLHVQPHGPWKHTTDTGVVLKEGKTHSEIGPHLDHYHKQGFLTANRSGKKVGQVGSQHAESVGFSDGKHLHAPPGGVTIHGVFYKGGEWIPKEVMAELSKGERSKLRAGSIARHVKARPELADKSVGGSSSPPSTPSSESKAPAKDGKAKEGSEVAAAPKKQPKSTKPVAPPSNEETTSEQLGDCYQSAFQELQSGELVKALSGNENPAKLCHGYPTHIGTGKPMGHAWVEASGLVIDHGKVIRKEQYYSVGKIDPNTVSRYTEEEAMKHAMKKRTWGPFEDKVADAVFRKFRGLPDLEPKLKKALDKIDKTYVPYDSEGTDTMSRHATKEGKWTIHRKVLHDNILSKHEGTPVENPEFVLMGGGPAAGKSSIIKAGKVTLPEGHVAINADEIKEMLPEYKAMVKHNDSRGAAYAHEESSYLSKRVMKNALSSKSHAVLDGTGDSSYDALKKKVDQARAAGHKVRGEYVTCKTDTAMARATHRGRPVSEGGSGRVVPETSLRETHSSVSRVLPQALKEGLFDEINLWDTEGGGAPVLVVSGKGKDVKIHDEAKWAEFLKKADE